MTNLASSARSLGVWAFASLFLGAVGCGSSTSDSSGGNGGTGGSTTTASSPDTTTGESTASLGQTTDATTSAATTGTDATSAASTGSSSGDPFAAERQICIDKINSLRATKGRAALTRWTDAEMCVDQEATSDEMTQMPHAAWGSGQYSCNGQGQNECLGQGPEGISACLDQMWAEKDQAECSGCDACAGAYNPDCPNCDFSGSKTNHVCGHYVNLSAEYFSKAACGFGAQKSWDAINFSP